MTFYDTDRWLDNVAAAALSSKETMRTSYDLACLAIKRGVPGDFVECGVFGGANAAAMARAIKEHPPSWPGNSTARRVHLFDTFTGIPAAGPEDVEFLQAGHPEGLSACSMEDVQANMQRWGLPAELFVYHKGLFLDEISVAMMSGWNMKDKSHLVHQIAVLRLDGDLYRSTKDSMELYRMVSPGGWVIVDDFNLSGCRQAIMEAFRDRDGSQGAPAPIYWQKGQ